jgi:hypothetical protein
MKLQVQDSWDASTYSVAIGDSSPLFGDDRIARVEWAFISELYEISDYVRDVRVGCGETSFEGEGFVAVSRPKSGELVWLALLRNAGAFRECRLFPQQIAVCSEYGVWWHFSLDSPENVIVRSTLDQSFGPEPGSIHQG